MNKLSMFWFIITSVITLNNPKTIHQYKDIKGLILFIFVMLRVKYDAYIQCFECFRAVHGVDVEQLPCIQRLFVLKAAVKGLNSL